MSFLGERRTYNFQGTILNKGKPIKGLTAQQAAAFQHLDAQLLEERAKKEAEQAEEGRLNQNLGETNAMGLEVEHATQMQDGGQLPLAHGEKPSDGIMSHLDQLSQSGGGGPSLMSQRDPSQSMGVQPPSFGQQSGFGLDSGLQQPQGGMLDMPQQAQQFAQEAAPTTAQEFSQSPDAITPQEREQYRPLGLHTLDQGVQDKMIWKHKNGMYKSDADFYREIKNTLKEKHDLDKILHEFGQKEGIKHGNAMEIEGMRQGGRQNQAEAAAQTRRDIAQLNAQSRERVAKTPSRTQQGQQVKDFGTDINAQERTVQGLARRLEDADFLPEEEAQALQASYNFAQNRLRNLHLADRFRSEGLSRDRSMAAAQDILSTGRFFVGGEGEGKNEKGQFNILYGPLLSKIMAELKQDTPLQEIIADIMSAE